MTALLIVPAILVLAWFAAGWLGPWFGSSEDDQRCSRIDRDLDDRMRRQYGGWRW